MKSRKHIGIREMLKALEEYTEINDLEVNIEEKSNNIQKRRKKKEGRKTVSRRESFRDSEQL